MKLGVRPRWVILGASGFIGTNLCLRLLNEGAEVVAFGRVNSRSPSINGCKWVFGDFFDLPSLSKALDKATYVVHAISTVTPASSNESPQSDVAENLIGTLQLMELCKANKIRRLIVLSSGGTVYGPGAPVPTPEEVPSNPICSYGIVKHAIEQYLRMYRQQGTLDSVVLRASNPFGPYQRGATQGVIATSIKRVLANKHVEILGDGNIVRDYIYIDDLVDAIILAAENNDHTKPHIYNIGSGIGRSLNEVIQSIVEVHGEVRINMLPGRPIDVPVSTLDIRRAESFLHWRPRTNWMDGIHLTYKWFRETHQAFTGQTPDHVYHDHLMTQRAAAA